MKKVFNNRFEMAKAFITNGDRRKWGEAEKFVFTEQFENYFYNRTIENFNKVVKDMAEFIKEKTTYTFPCEYESICTYADGYFTDFDVIVTPIPYQLTFNDI